MALNPLFPNYANGANSSLVLTGPYTITGLALYQLPTMLVETGFGAASVAEGGTTQSPTHPEGDYVPNPNIVGAGTITGVTAVGQTLTFTPGTITGTPAPTATYQWCWYAPTGLTVRASGLSYTLASADLGKRIVVKTTASNTEGTIYTISTPVGPITGTAPVITNPGAITPAVVYPGQTLSITSAPAATGTPAPALSWNWIQVGGPTPNVPVQLGGNTYMAKLSDVGYQIGLEVIATNSSATTYGYSPTSDCQGLAPAVAVAPRLSTETPIIGQRLGGIFGRFSGFPTPLVNDWGFAWYDPGTGTGAITNLTLTDPGQNYFTLLGDQVALTFTGDGAGAAGYATLNPVGDVIGVDISDGQTTTPGGSGTITLTGTGSETPLVISWVTTDPTTTVVDQNPSFTGGANWTQQHINDCIAGTYGSIAYSGDSITFVSMVPYVASVIQSVTLTSGGSNYTTVAVSVTQVGNPLQIDAVVSATISGGGGGATYTPIPGADKIVSYLVSELDIDKQIVFYATASNTSGTLTAYSAPTWQIAENLGIKTEAKLSVPAPGVPEVGMVLTGTPATFRPSIGVTVTNAWAYLNADQTTTPISGATGLTYTLVEGDVGKNIVFLSTGSTTTPAQTVTSQSNSSGVVRDTISLVTNPSWVFTNAAPEVGELIQLLPGTTDPAHNLQTPPGPAVVKEVIVYRIDPDLPDPRVEIGYADYPDSADLYLVVPEEAYGQVIQAEVIYEYNDGFGTSDITGYGNTPAVTATAPTIVTPGSISGVFQYNQTLTYTPATFVGDPTPTVTWLWKNQNGDIMQNGGLTFQLTQAMIGMQIGVVATGRNVAGAVQSPTAFTRVAGDEPAFVTNGTLVGAAEIGTGTTLTYIPATATSPTDRPVVTWEWYIQYPGPLPPVALNRAGQVTVTFTNDNGKWTNGTVYVLATATNRAGTATATSNNIGPMLGSPRLLQQGRLWVTIGTAADKYLNFNPSTWDGAGSPVLRTWFAGVTNGVTGFAEPTTQRRLLPGDSNKNAGCDERAQNEYGTTLLIYDPVPVGPVA